MIVDALQKPNALLIVLLNNRHMVGIHVIVFFAHRKRKHLAHAYWFCELNSSIDVVHI